MSVNQFPKCAAANESNIPVPKRINTGIKKSKRCSQLPELQKYIETIIKASNEYDSEDTSVSDRERFPKDRKFARYSVYKGADSKVKAEKFKNQLNMNRSKNNIKAKTPISEAVSRGVRVYSAFVPEFEDPRNWKSVKNQNSSPSPCLEIENFLKKFYPNPYHLESVNEFNPTKNDEDKFRDVGTLPDVAISKANIHIEVGIEKRDIELETADFETCKRENKDTNLNSDTSLENHSQPSFETNQEDTKNIEIYSVSVPILSKKSSRLTSINSTSNTSSRASSLESISETHSKSSSKKRKNIKLKSRHKPLKNERYSDYDIGKLKLLHLTDSEKSLTKLRIENSMQDENNESLCEDMYKTDDLNDMKEIYDIMHKATESFLYISSKSELYAASLTQSNIISNELNKNIEVSNSVRVKSETNSDKIENEICRTKEQKVNDRELKVVEKEEPGVVEKRLIDVLLKEDKFEYRRNPEDREPEQALEHAGSVPNNEAFTSVEHCREGAFQQNEGEKHLTDTNEKNDEVLNFMYGCLKKFNAKEKPPPADGKKSEDEKPLEKSISCKRFRKESVTAVNYEKPTTSGSPRPTDFAWLREHDATENLLPKTFPDIKEIQSKYSAALGEINRKAPRGKTKKRLPQIFPGFESASHHHLMPVIQPPTYQQAVEQSTENVSTIQTVESQNELGAYTEETHEILIPHEETRTPKQICPLSVKRKNSKINTGKTLKDVLEAEEKLLSAEHVVIEKEKKGDVKTKDLITCASAHQVRIKNDSGKLCQLGDFKRSSSNFVICVNSFPRNLKSLTAIKPTLPVPLSVSLGDLKGNWKMKQLTLCHKHPLKKLIIPLETGCCVVEYTYNIKNEVLLMVNQTAVAYTARPVGLKIVSNLSKQVNEFPLQNSECVTRITVKPVQKSNISDNKDSITVVQPASVRNAEDDKPVKALIEAIEETEEKLFLLEQSSAENLYRRNSEMCSLSASDTLKNEFSELEVEKVSDRKKVHELLVRTYNLQQKLHKYLQKTSLTQPTSVSCPLVKDEGVLDFTVANSAQIELDIKPESSLPLVHWHLKPPEIDKLSKTDESVTVNVSMIDHGTSYDPPEDERNCEKTEETNQLSKKSDDRYEDPENEEDDRSSNYSFKSSNDFSESSEVRNVKKETKHWEHMTTKKYFQKIFNQIESFRKSFEAEKLEKQQQAEFNPVPLEEQIDRRVSQYDPKSPAKVLRTVFTGTKSSTELTIGLKDVPMTKVGNISVEKTKFSPNHTKISVAFTKEPSEEQHNKMSYYFDHMRPSLSTCLTDYSGLKYDDSKSSKSINGDSEDEEDDYKSVGSKPGDSDIEEEEEEDEKSEPKVEKVEEPPAPKNYTKHRFDFYQKMNTDFDLEKSSPKLVPNSVCTYKELEPLKQALTEMQIRMRNIRRDAVFSSNDYYERALKLAKMSAGFCQSCGNRAVIPNDTFGYYRTLLPRRSTHQRRNRHFRPTLTSNPSFYSMRTSHPEFSDHFCDLGIKHSSYMLNSRLHSNRTIFRSSLHDMPILFERM